MIRSALLAALLAAVPLVHAAPDLVTVSERSGFTATGRYDEVVKLCSAFQQAYPKQVKCFQFGTTPEGRPMLALAVNANGVFSADAARKAIAASPQVAAVLTRQEIYWIVILALATFLGGFFAPIMALVYFFQTLLPWLRGRGRVAGQAVTLN